MIIFETYFGYKSVKIIFNCIKFKLNLFFYQPLKEWKIIVQEHFTN